VLLVLKAVLELFSTRKNKEAKCGKKPVGRGHKTHSAVSRGIRFLLHHMLKNNFTHA